MSLMKQPSPSRNPAQVVFARGSLRSQILELESPMSSSRQEESTVGVPLPLTPKVTYYPSQPHMQERRLVGSRHGSIDSIQEEDEEDSSLGTNRLPGEVSW